MEESTLSDYSDYEVKSNNSSSDEIELAPDSDDDYGTDCSEEEAESNASYGNFRILNKNGELIGLCDFKRFKWYLRQNLASKVDDKTLKINFEPNYKNGKAIRLVERDTLCVVCGSNNKLRKFHVVPLQFKRHFPVEKKEHNSTDVILVCKSCSVTANNVTDQFKKIVFDQLGVSVRDFTDNTNVDVRKFAVKIQKNNNHGKSSEKEMKMLKTLLKLNDEDIISEEDLNKYCNISCNKTYEGFESIGEYVTNKFNEKGKIDYFSQKWKENFNVNLNPQYLPKDFFTDHIPGV